MFDHLKTLIHAAPAATPVVVAPKPAPKPAPVVEVAPENSGISNAAPVEVVPVPAPAPEEPRAVAKISKEPTIVEYTPEPVVVAPKGTPLVDPAGNLRGYLRPDGLFVAVTEESDPLTNLKEEDRRPVDPEEEARVDLPQRTSGRITFLTATYESEKEDPKYPDRRTKRLANDLARNHHARPASIFDPEKTPAAESIKKWIQ